MSRKICLLLCLLLLTACNFNPELPTPTAEGIDDAINPIPNVDQTVTPSNTPSPHPTLTVEVALLVSSTPSGTALPPSATVSPIPTQGPFEHVIQSGDTLYTILPQYGYRDTGPESEVRRLNPGIPDLNNLPLGRTILIPRPSATPTPQGYELTEVAFATLGITPIQALPTNAVIDCYTVQEGDSPVGIAEDFNTTLEIISQLNPEIYFAPTCDFNIRSGGENCTVLINIGQCVRVPFPTATITQSPSPSGSETPTPTPTYAPLRIVQPPSGSIITASVELAWVSAGLLREDEAYFIQIYDPSNPETPPVWGVSHTNSFRLPESIVPTDGNDRLYEWTVSVAKRNAQGAYALIGAPSARQQFTLRSR